MPSIQFTCVLDVVPLPCWGICVRATEQTDTSVQPYKNPGGRLMNENEIRRKLAEIMERIKNDPSSYKTYLELKELIGK